MLKHQLANLCVSAHLQLLVIHTVDRVLTLYYFYSNFQHYLCQLLSFYLLVVVPNQTQELVCFLLPTYQLFS